MYALRFRVVLVLIGLLAIDTLPGVGRAAPLGTAFTYQGQLQQNGTPANGSCDMQFTLFDGDTVGAGQIGSTQPAAAVNVTNGLFTVALDFGTGVFTGADRYLEIQVRCPAGGGSYVTLSPRQKLTAAPYALYAPTAGNLSGAVAVVDGNIVLPESTATAGNILKSNEGTNVPFIHNFGTNNTFVGESAGNFSMSGAENTALGHSALSSNTNGSYNTGLGKDALASNTGGGANTALGDSSLAANTTAYDNTAVGINALYSNIAGNSNTAVGANALYSNTTGLNTAVGTNALYSNTTGYGNTAVGGIALVSNVTGGDNTAVGSFTLVSNTTGYDNTAVGSYALGYDTEICTGPGTPYACCTGAATGNCEGRDNTAVGAWTLSSNTTGSENTALGSGALMSNVTGYYNTAVGSYALGYDIEYCTGPGTPDPCCTGNGTGNCEGNDNTAVGAETLFSNTTGNQNTAVGTWTLHFNATGVENTALGSGALLSNITGGYNTAVGSLALGYDIEYCTGAGTPDPCCTGNRTGNCEGYGNTAVGAETLLANTTGVDNTAVGVWTLWANTTGVNNTALGSGALQSNTTGGGNTALGSEALLSNTTGGGNTAVGQNAMNSNAQCTAPVTPLSCCTGAGAGNCTTTGNRNIAVGLDAGSNFTGFETSNINVGSAGAQGDYSTIRIGTDFSCQHSPVFPYLCIFGTQKGQDRTFIAGISGVTSSSGTAVYINSSGQLGTLTSSARFKDDIQDIGGASDGLLQLRPVRFRYKKDIDPSGLEQYGLVAEEVAKVYPDLVTHDDQGRPESVRYHFVNAMLLNEVQKQARQLKAQAKQVEAHKAQIAEQTRRIEEQARQIEALTEQNRQLAEQALEIQALSARLAQLEATQQHAAAIKVSGKEPAGL